MKKILIILAVIIVAFVAYAFFISGKGSSNGTGVTKQAVTSGQAQTGTATLDGPGKEFVTQLLAIQNIKFNFSLFEDAVFQGLQDWSRELVPQESGRPNPFAPIGSAGLSQGAAVSQGFEDAFVANSSASSSATTRTATSTAPRTTTGTGAARR